ncbi:DDB1- and CUL4-associated factor 8 isoform X1 [Morus notabilis]|uniref:DDB1- and CUL4-associated factor 8 isoform X1 n=1 Tax=Morus notabilis TaxID=981085 RepID=UPI000CED7738|nr:DDB1- and CUL4-associated factor 8 isoform X1 [Morus notabilis]
MMRRARSGADNTVVDVSLRELGSLPARNFALRLGASEDLVLRLELYRRLEHHRGCVNTVSFNADGRILVSGSDDMRVILWDWDIGQVKLAFDSGHLQNVFQAKFIPYSDDRRIVTCAADGQVRFVQILEGGRVETSLLGEHLGQAHKLAIVPGSPHIFYSCGEDGLVQLFDLRTSAATELFICQSIDYRRNVIPVVQLNAIAIDPRNPDLFAVAGSDENTRLYDIRRYGWYGSSDFGEPVNYFCPSHLIGDQRLGITCLAFSERSELLVSYNREHIYLFTQEMGSGPTPPSPSGVSSSALDVDEKMVPQVYSGHMNFDTVKGVNFFGPKCEYVVSGSDCGRIFIWKTKGGELIRVIERADLDVVNCIEPHPRTMVLASCGIEHDIKIWTPKALERAELPVNIQQVLPRRIRWFSFGGDDDESDDCFYDDDEDSDDYDDDDDDDESDDDDDDDSNDDDSNNDNSGGDEANCGDDKNDRDNSVKGYDDSNGDYDFELLFSASAAAAAAAATQG